ncbi:MAG: hypothetical protein SF069_13050 [Phycisphaerae bacterium]|nr:hypothetical protein [Phycisphaerae bacterium]
MKKLFAPVCTLAVALAIAAPAAFATTPEAGTAPAVEPVDTVDNVTPQLDGINIENAGADVVTGNMAVPAAFGNVTVGADTFRAFSIGTTSCNIGTVPLNWVQSNNNHPVISQDVYRINSQGRFEQIGMGWLKHSFCALQSQGGLPNGFCASCSPTCGGCCSTLGVGCWDPYTSARNGSQNLLGPRSDINATTGAFPYPYTIAFNATGNAIYKRIQVNINDLNPALNPGAIYYVQTGYVARDDALAGNGNNNVSSRQALIGGVNPNFSIGLTGTFNTTVPTIRRWPTHVPGAVVNQVFLDGANLGSIDLGGYARDNGDGTWTYNYAVYNMNSHNSVYAFEVDAPSGLNITNVGMTFPKYHSGEPYTNNAWTGSYSGGKVRWIADATLAGNPNANALRWSTTYTFFFTANVGPTNGNARIEAFRTAATASTTLPVPSAPPILIGDMNCDGIVSVGDIAGFVLALTDPAGYASTYPTCNINAGDINGDSVISVGDIAGFVTLLTGP